MFAATGDNERNSPNSANRLVSLPNGITCSFAFIVSWGMFFGKTATASEHHDS